MEALLQEAHIGFGLTERQHMVASMVKDFAAREMAPHIMEWDETQHFPLHVFKAMGQLGQA